MRPEAKPGHDAPEGERPSQAPGSHEPIIQRSAPQADRGAPWADGPGVRGSNQPEAARIEATVMRDEEPKILGLGKDAGEHRNQTSVIRGREPGRACKSADVELCAARFELAEGTNQVIPEEEVVVIEKAHEIPLGQV